MTKLLWSKFHIHPVFWFVIFSGVITGHFKEISIIFLIVFIHEMGHVLAAHFFKWRIKEVILLPFGGVASLDEYGNRPLHEEFIVLIAGPIQHLVLLGLFWLLHTNGFINDYTYHLFLINNAMILAFNLLPIWPLDGGKLLFLLLSIHIPFKKAHKLGIITSLGLLIIFSLMTFFYSTFHLNLIVIQIFLIFSLIDAWKKRGFVQIRFLLERFYGKQNNSNALERIVVDENTLLLDILSQFLRGTKHEIVISSKNKVVDEWSLLSAYFVEKRINCAIGEVFR